MGFAPVVSCVCLDVASLVGSLELLDFSCADCGGTEFSQNTVHCRYAWLDAAGELTLFMKNMYLLHNI